MATDTSTIVKRKTKTIIEPPKSWKVIILNDDKTPMEFVVTVLMEIFRHSREDATQLMMKIHTEGSAIAGVYSYEIAETKALETVEAAKANKFPLQAKAEPE